jgi:hypothetical protein
VARRRQGRGRRGEDRELEDEARRIREPSRRLRRDERTPEREQHEHDRDRDHHCHDPVERVECPDGERHDRAQLGDEEADGQVDGADRAHGARRSVVQPSPLRR